MKFSNMCVAKKNRNTIPLWNLQRTQNTWTFCCQKSFDLFWNILQFVFEFSAHAGSDELWAKNSALSYLDHLLVPVIWYLNKPANMQTMDAISET
jgi:hypothetical protein